MLLALIMQLLLLVMLLIAMLLVLAVLFPLPALLQGRDVDTPQGRGGGVEDVEEEEGEGKGLDAGLRLNMKEEEEELLGQRLCGIATFTLVSCDEGINATVVTGTALKADADNDVAVDECVWIATIGILASLKLLSLDSC